MGGALPNPERWRARPRDDEFACLFKSLIKSLLLLLLLLLAISQKRGARHKSILFKCLQRLKMCQ